MTYVSGITAQLDSGNVAAAVELALAWVKAEPSSTEARRLLIDLLIIGGDFERADKQADILSKVSPDLALAMSLIRGRLRAANARAAWFLEGAVPAFPEGPTSRDQVAMELAVAERVGITHHVEAALSALTAISETSGMIVNGKSTETFRDADDRVPHALEVLCTNGSYMWVDFDLIEAVTFGEVKTVRDLAWRSTKLTLRDGSESEVVTCGTYYATDQTDSHRLARSTDWVELAAGSIAGKGQKAFLSGDDALFALDLKTLAAS